MGKFASKRGSFLVVLFAMLFQAPLANSFFSGDGLIDRNGYRAVFTIAQCGAIGVQVVAGSTGSTADVDDVAGTIEFFAEIVGVEGVAFAAVVVAGAVAAREGEGEHEASANSEDVKGGKKLFHNQG